MQAAAGAYPSNIMRGSLLCAGFAACQEADRDLQEQLVSHVDQGCARPHSCDLPNSTAGRMFRQQCLRHMYVLCSRAVDSSASGSCLLQVCCKASALASHSISPACCGPKLSWLAAHVRSKVSLQDWAALLPEFIPRASLLLHLHARCCGLTSPDHRCSAASTSELRLEHAT